MLDQLLDTFCYSLEDDSWDTDGRRSYSNCENASKAFVRAIAAALRMQGFYPHGLRLFQNFETGEIIEIEPGGSGVTGHLLHHMKREMVE